MTGNTAVWPLLPAEMRYVPIFVCTVRLCLIYRQLYIYIYTDL
jgi:hypothetical protein